MRRNPGATAALLQKANCQLKGEKIAKPEDELNDYISSLAHKTSQVKKSVNFEELSEGISISSDLEDIPIKPTAVPAPSSAGSKFLKKKPAGNEDVTDSLVASKFLKKPQVASASPTPAVQGAGQVRRYGAQPNQSPGSRPGSQLSGSGNQPVGRQAKQGSSALDKVSALQGKMQQKAATRRVFTLESDSDESFSAVKMAKSVSEPLSDSVTTESVKVGRDGGKFMKKASPSPVAASSEPPLASVNKQASSSAFKPGLKQAPSLQANKQTTPQKKASPFTLKSSLRHGTDVVLTSEEESLAEFVGGLPSSSGDSFEKPRPQYGRSSRRHTPSPPLRHGQRGPSPQPDRPPSRGQSRSPSPVKQQIRRSPSPRAGQTPSPNLRRRSPSPKLMRSYSDDSNMADSLKSEVAEDYDLGMNTMSTSTPRVKKRVVIMDLEDLGPAEESLPEAVKPRPESPHRSSRKTDKHSRGSKKSSLKSASDSSLKDKDRGSPFKVADRDTGSPFKAASKDKDRGVSPFKSNKDRDSPFKSSAGRDESPFKSSSKTRDKSPFAAASESPFKSSGSKEKSSFKAKESSSPFKADKQSYSPFSAKSRDDSPFKAKDRGGSSPFKASNEGSAFKASDKKGSPFKAKSSSRYDDSDRSTSRGTPRKSRSKTRKQKKDNKSSKKSKSKTGSGGGVDVFSSFGVQTVEDLLGSSVKVSEYESIADDDRSDVSEDIRTERPSAYSYRFEESVTEIATEVNGTKQSAPTYTDDFDSISEKIGVMSDIGRSSASEVRTRYSGEETVASYTEFDESDTETIDSRTYTDTLTESRTYSETPRRDDDSYTYSEDFTKSLVPTSRSDVTLAPPRGKAHSGVQTSTAVDGGLHYSWDPRASGMAFPGSQFGLGFVDPTPIASHVVSADALEAMTAYSPAMLALHDMLRSQLELTRDFLEGQRQLYQEFANKTEATFHYTTLEDTKKFIKKNKKKKLSFKEALRLVDQEMSR